MIFDSESFSSRHIGPDSTEREAMLKAVGAESLDALMEEAIPPGIRLDRPLRLPAGESEYRFLQEMRRTAARNEVFQSYLGLGYYDCITPSVILRNVLENPGWYTPYTPFTRLRSRRAGWRVSSTSRRPSGILPEWRLPTLRSSTKRPPRPRR